MSEPLPLDPDDFDEGDDFDWALAWGGAVVVLFIAAVGAAIGWGVWRFWK